MEITITACQRHKVLEKTLATFRHNLFLGNVECTYINIDPVGPDKTPTHCLDVARLYCGKVIARTPEKPNFSEAFKWAWSQVKSDYVLHLEDDWELLRPIDLQKIIELLETEPDLALLRLPQFASQSNSMKNWNLYFPYNGRYFECPENLKMSVGFCGHPSIIKGKFIRHTVPYIDTKINPEKQFHRGPKEIMAEVARWRYGVYANPNEPNAIADLGRKWMVENKLRKQGNKAWFMQWEEDNEPI